MSVLGSSTTGVNFDQQSAKRIAKVVRDYERKFGAATARPSAIIPPPQRFWVQLQDESSDNPGEYNWKKQDFVAGVFQDTDPLNQDNANYSAHEANLSSGLANEYVELEFAGYDDDENPVYLFSSASTLPRGQRQYMLFQMVSQNQTGWDFARAHPMIGS